MGVGGMGKGLTNPDSSPAVSEDDAGDLTADPTVTAEEDSPEIPPSKPRALFGEKAI